MPPTRCVFVTRRHFICSFLFFNNTIKFRIVLNYYYRKTRHRRRDGSPHVAQRVTTNVLREKKEKKNSALFHCNGVRKLLRKISRRDVSQEKR